MAYTKLDAYLNEQVLLGIAAGRLDVADTIDSLIVTLAAIFSRYPAADVRDHLAAAFDAIRQMEQTMRAKHAGGAHGNA